MTELEEIDLLQMEIVELTNTCMAQAECIKANTEERQDWQREVLAAKSDAEALKRALELIAAPMRPDGTWNRDRLACQQIAAEALAARPGEKG